jgi:hypothetical protein
MSTETASLIVSIFYIILMGFTAVMTVYLMYWLVVEAPVLVRLKREELYDYWKYPNARGDKHKPKVWEKR